MPAATQAKSNGHRRSTRATTTVRTQPKRRTPAQKAAARDASKRSTSKRVPAAKREPSEQELAVRGAAVRAKARRTVSVGVDKPNADTQISGLFEQYAPLSYLMPWSVLGYVELLATYNPDYSQAVENAKMLANTGHTLYVEGGKRVAKDVKRKLEEKARTIQERHGGIDGLIEKLLDQALTFGAMCGEWVPNEDLTDIVDFIDVNPKYIRFFWEDEHWAPYQKVDSKGVEEAKARGQKIRNSNCIKLNETTFRYFAFDAAPGSPYGTPPFLASLTNISIQRDMVANMAQIVKKIGLLGIVDLTVKSLPKSPAETQEAYEARAGAYLDNYVPVIEDMVKEGGLVHFDDLEAHTWQIGGNAAGATAIFKQNEELIFSGLKSMPSVQGRSYSTTETYAGVAYEIILRNVAKYQRAVRRMIESGYWLMVSLWGDTPDKIKLKFNNNRELNRLQAAQAEKAELEVAVLLWSLGLIDQVALSQILNAGDPVVEYESVLDTPYMELEGKSKQPASDGGAADSSPPAPSDQRPPGQNSITDEDSGLEEGEEWPDDPDQDPSGAPQKDRQLVGAS